jgi:hypothetical protein
MALEERVLAVISGVRGVGLGRIDQRRRQGDCVQTDTLVSCFCYGAVCISRRSMPAGRAAYNLRPRFRWRDLYGTVSSPQAFAKGTRSYFSASRTYSNTSCDEEFVQGSWTPWSQAHRRAFQILRPARFVARYRSCSDLR